MTLLLRTTHGSRLYGLLKDTSDYDIYEVHDDRKPAQQWVCGREDVTQIGLSEWLAQCERGVPQALEAMFAPAEFADVDRLARYRLGYRANVGNAAETYTRAIAKFMVGNAKQVLTSSRLRRDLNELRRYGRFDPTAFGRYWNGPAK